MTSTTPRKRRPPLTQEVREYARIKLEIDELTAQLKTLKARKTELEHQLLERFAQGHIQRQTVDGVTVYVHRQVWANCKDKQAGYDALIADGLEEYATRGFNTNSVSALFREWEANDEKPPPNVAAAFELREQFTLNAVKA